MRSVLIQVDEATGLVRFPETDAASYRMTRGRMPS